MKVFIADDSDHIRSSIKGLLNDISGVEVIGEASETKNLDEIIIGLKPNAVILDIKMPGGGGIGVLKKIKEKDPSVFVIMFTNYGHDIYRKKCMELGADFFFEKSVEFEKIETVLNKLAHDLSVSTLNN